MTGEARGSALPAGLRERVLAASLRARAAGRPEPVPEAISPRPESSPTSASTAS